MSEISDGILNRMHLFAVYKKMRVNDIYESMGTHRNTLYQQVMRKCTISRNMQARFALHYPELNLDWILTGEGQMLHGSISKEQQDEDLRAIIIEKDKQIERLLELVAKLIDEK